MANLPVRTKSDVESSIRMTILKGDIIAASTRLELSDLEMITALTDVVHSITHGILRDERKS